MEKKEDKPNQVNPNPVTRKKKNKDQKELKTSKLDKAIMEKGKLGEKVEEIFKNSKLQRGLVTTGEIQQELVNQQEEICLFCERNRPIFLVDSDDMIMRMQERFLPTFLKQLKQDYIQKM